MTVSLKFLQKCAAPGRRGAPVGRTVAAAALLAVTAGCTTTGTGIGDSSAPGMSATFTWRAQGARTGEMTAALANGSQYSGSFFQVTRETRIDDLGPLWEGWAPAGPFRRWRGGWRGGWGGWGYWGPDQSFVTHYSGKVLANLKGPDGNMRCRFTLARPSSGMAGGGEGQCQLPGGTKIHADFPRA